MKRYVFDVVEMVKGQQRTVRRIVHETESDVYKAGFEAAVIHEVNPAGLKLIEAIEINAKQKESIFTR